MDRASPISGPGWLPAPPCRTAIQSACLATPSARHHTVAHAPVPRPRNTPRMPGFTKTKFIWMNGEMVPWNEAQVHVTAHALHYGSGVFEGMRSYDTPDGPAIFRLDAHMRRFEASARAYELPIPYTIDQLSAASLA